MGGKPGDRAAALSIAEDFFGEVSFSSAGHELDENTAHALGVLLTGFLLDFGLIWSQPRRVLHA